MAINTYTAYAVINTSNTSTTVYPSTLNTSLVIGQPVIPSGTYTTFSQPASYTGEELHAARLLGQLDALIYLGKPPLSAKLGHAVYNGLYAIYSQMGPSPFGFDRVMVTSAGFAYRGVSLEYEPNADPHYTQIVETRDPWLLFKKQLRDAADGELAGLIASDPCDTWEGF